MSAKASPRARDSKSFTPSNNDDSRLSFGPDHHVTEAIGDMYGDLGDSDNRYSFVPSSGADSRNPHRLSTGSTLSVPTRDSRGVAGSTNGTGATPPSPTVTLSPVSPTLGALGDVEYESDPVAVAQEISNLQALRRMSMDVTSAADPDLPSFNSFVPSTPPDDNGDPGSVFWVPARLHPELAPQEFSAFLEAKKNEIRRPSTDGSLSPGGGSPTGSLRRKKSMLSRQIDSREGSKEYQDGAERLTKRNSLRGVPEATVTVDDLLNDPSALMQKLSVDARRTNMEEGDDEKDMPIIQAPKGGLKRSTATHYRKGSLRRGERVGSVRRLAAAARAFADGASGSSGEPTTPVEAPEGFKLNRVNTEPSALPSQSRKDERDLNRNLLAASTSNEELVTSGDTARGPPAGPPPEPPATTATERHRSAPAKTKRPSSPKPARTRISEPAPPVPKIIETPPPQEPIAERAPSVSSTHSEPAARKRPPIPKTRSWEHQPEEADADPKPKKRESAGTSKDRKTSWSWLSRDSAEKEEHKEAKAREKEEKHKAKKEKRPKSTEKLTKPDDRDKKRADEKRPKSTEKYDNTRLDVLQKSIEMGHTSGTLVAVAEPVSASSGDKESRRSRGEDSNKKDSSFFNFFSGGRKKSDSGKSGKSGRSRDASPEPPRQKPQQDYYYTRFPIHIERAIYRLSHLKLANPRRPLQQQVLLSNFMYSYLAKVQMTQPGLVAQAGSRQQEQQMQQQQYQQQQMQQQQGNGGGQQYYYDEYGQQGDYVDDSYDYDDDERAQHAQYQHENGYDAGDQGVYYGHDGQAHGGQGAQGQMW